MAGRDEKKEVNRFCVDLSDPLSAKLEQLAKYHATTKSDVIKKLIEAASMPARERGERLCVCDGSRVLREIAGV